MLYSPRTLADLASHGFDTVIDVRSPAEWAEDHVPGAINLPVLDNEERARVGTIYKQVSPFDARKLGAALVARNAASHLMGPLAAKQGNWRPLVYCWRGGQRSNSFATILSQIGWRVAVLEGGYRTWRRMVAAALYETDLPCRLVVLDGNTGTAKTDLLARVAALGHQTLDIEALANHRGSLFGALGGGQPSQRAFEGRLAMAFHAFDPTRPVLVEAESSKVGDCRMPPALWKAMQAAPRIVLSAPIGARARYLARAYADLTRDRAELHAIIDRLRPMQPAETIAHWHALAAQGAMVDLAADLMSEHYDPRYTKSRARYRRPDDRVLETDTLDDAALDALAQRIGAAIGDPAGSAEMRRG